jgi:hypothetical protein
MKPHTLETTTIRGPQAEELLDSALRILRRCRMGVLAQCDPSGYHRVLWAGPVRVREGGRCLVAEGMDFSRLLEIREVLWAFTDEHGATVRLYGTFALRAKHTPMQDEHDLPLELVTETRGLRVDVPSHGISLLGILPDKDTPSSGRRTGDASWDLFS